MHTILSSNGEKNGEIKNNRNIGALSLSPRIRSNDKQQITEEPPFFKNLKLAMGSANDVNNIPSEQKTIDIENLPDNFSSEVNVENTKKIIGGISENADPDALALYNRMKDWQGALNSEVYYFDYINKLIGIKDQRDLNKVTAHLLSIDENNPSGGVISGLHEMAHLVDCFASPSSEEYSYFTTNESSLDDYLLNPLQEVGELVDPLNPTFSEFMKPEMADALAKYNEECNKIKTDIYKKYQEDIDSAASKKDRDRFIRNRDKAIERAHGNVNGGGYDLLQDIYDGLSSGEFSNNREEAEDNAGEEAFNRGDGVALDADNYVYYGHTNFKKEPDNIRYEIFADYLALSVTRPDLIDMLNRDKPKLVEALRATVAEMGEVEK